MKKLATSRLTTKYQATIPAAVRKKLGLGKGDVVCFEETKEGVVLRKALPADLAYTRAVMETLGEWSSREDDEAFHDL
ncbi:MAG: AbrB/MazE/SpoVT family DNA-binding domain-containing protein [bacterium]|nr:AbrB/MazE/SpoVT family DNA-binding domain-containing protein [bacterium]